MVCVYIYIYCGGVLFRCVWLFVSPLVCKCTTSKHVWVCHSLLELTEELERVAIDPDRVRALCMRTGVPSELRSQIWKVAGCPQR